MPPIYSPLLPPPVSPTNGDQLSSVFGAVPYIWCRNPGGVPSPTNYRGATPPPPGNDRGPLLTHPIRQKRGWIEAFPTAQETADTVATILLQHIIPRFGLPISIQSDNRPAFVSQVVQQVSEALQITWTLHIPYHPQSSGKIERANGILKDHLTKLSLEVRISWPNLLPLALTRIRASLRTPSSLSPFELLYGHPFLLHNLPTQNPPLASYLPYLSLLRHLLREHADHNLPTVTASETSSLPTTRR
ncbi:uncharacterized protein LOC111179699 [Delphinapterus leucas]|uniref:Uncharacterized protein LOC111179699 n=1 Tax=Delphinapterus leucas TaxID=9749 RepID=A0A2Y9PA39_DELLE|nr:uncharacterized protein LOC111179699 [Delphinapterus leucas]